LCSLIDRTDFIRGLIVQWGRIKYSNPDPQSITLPTPYTSSNYKVVGCYYYSDQVPSARDLVTIASQSTTKFELYMSNTTDYYANWLAIGY